MKKALLAFALSLVVMFGPCLSSSQASTLSKVGDSFNPEPESNGILAASMTEGVVALTAVGAVAAPFAVAAIGGMGIVYLIFSGFDPWTPLFGKTEETYPDDKNNE